MSGARTIIAALIAIASQVALLAGIDLGAVLAEHGIQIDVLADQITGALNLAIGIGASIAAVWFRYRAKRDLSPGSGAGTLQCSPVVTMAAVSLAALVVMATTGCASFAKPRPPGNLLESIESVELGIQHAARAVGSITCPRSQWVPERATCATPGHPIAPTHGLAMLDRLEELHQAMAQVQAINVSGIGMCLGQERSAAQCVAAVQAALLMIETQLGEVQ